MKKRKKMQQTQNAYKSEQKKAWLDTVLTILFIIFLVALYEPPLRALYTQHGSDFGTYMTKPIETVKNAIHNAHEEDSARSFEHQMHDEKGIEQNVLSHVRSIIQKYQDQHNRELKNMWEEMNRVAQYAESINSNNQRIIESASADALSDAKQYIADELKNSKNSLVQALSITNNDLQQLRVTVQKLSLTIADQKKSDIATDLGTQIEEIVQVVQQRLRSESEMPDNHAVNAALLSIEELHLMLRDVTTAAVKLQAVVNEIGSKQQKDSRVLFEEISSIRQDVQHLHANVNALGTSVHNSLPSININNSDFTTVQYLIDQALERYSADFTDEIDFALKSSGGTVLASSPTYRPPLPARGSDFLARAASIIFGPTSPVNLGRPDEVITARHSVGECWPMNSTHGWVILKLREPILPTKITLQHVSPHIVPDNSTMPRTLVVYGVPDYLVWNATNYHTNEHPIGDFLGKLTYIQGHKQLQESLLLGNSLSKVYQVLTVSILENYGNPNYTCIYRIRVHGTPTIRHGGPRYIESHRVI